MRTPNSPRISEARPPIIGTPSAQSVLKVAQSVVNSSSNCLRASTSGESDSSSLTKLSSSFFALISSTSRPAITSEETRVSRSRSIPFCRSNKTAFKPRARSRRASKRTS